MTMVELVESLPTKKGTAIVYKTDFRTFRLSYKEFYKKILKACSLFEYYKIQKGDKIMIWGRNSPQWGYIFLAAAIKGIVIVPVDYMAKKDHFKKIYDILLLNIIIFMKINISVKISIFRKF